MVGNKIDLKNLRAVSFDEAKSYAISKNIDYFETSALLDRNINEVFLKLIHNMYIISKKGVFRIVERLNL